MHNFMLLGITDWIADFFQEVFNLIPKIIYLLYASLACLLDVFQLALRKLAGLDVYYDSQGIPVGGDIVTNFIAGILGIHFDGNERGFDYSALSTVFWAFVVFGVIITFVSVFVALIKSHYNYDDKAAKGPMQYVYAGLKALLNIVVVPIIVVLGLYVSQAVLTAVDSISAGSTAAGISDFNTEEDITNGKYSDLQSVSTSRALADNSQNKGESTYIFYDIFGVGGHIRYGKSSGGLWKWGDDDELVLTGAATQTFSGQLFRAAAYNGNRARTGQIVVGNTTIYGLEANGLFSNPQESESKTKQQALADMIDTAFACHLHLSDHYLETHSTVQYAETGAGDWTSSIGVNFFYTEKIDSFSKFNVGAVWYYYDLWQFNFIVGFGAVIVCVSLFINIILGLMTRIFMCLGLFLIAPPLFGLGPVDNGNAAKGWRENFMKQVLMAYGAILGMNIFFLIFPLINQIKFFNIPIADAFMTTLIIIVGLISIKAFIGVVSGLVGGEDASKTGEGMKEEVGQTIGKATKLAVGAATAPFKVASGAVHAGVAVKNAAQAAYQGFRSFDNKMEARAYEKENKKTDKLIERSYADIKSGSMSEADFIAKGGNSDLYNSIKNSSSMADARSAYSKTAAGATYASNAQIAKSYRDLSLRRAKLKNAATARMRRHKTAAEKGIFSPLTLAKDSLLGDKGLKGFTDTIWKPRDFARETADNTSAMLGQMKTMNSGVDLMNSGMDQLNGGMGTLNRNVQSGFEQVGNKIDESSRIAQEMVIDKQHLDRKQKTLEQNRAKVQTLQKQIQQKEAEKQKHKGNVKKQQELDKQIDESRKKIIELNKKINEGKKWD